MAVANDVDRNGDIRTGSILIESMTLAGSRPPAGEDLSPGTNRRDDVPREEA